MDIELCELQKQSSADVKAGRVGFTMSGLKICRENDFSDYNKNGLHWDRSYVTNNLSSAIGMPFVVRFLDEERTMISDHGRMENDIEDGTIVFPDSDTVGYVEEAWIAEKIIEGNKELALFVKGYLFSQRYHELVKMLRTALSNGEKVKGSIEISPKPGNKGILYSHGYGSRDAEGKLIMGRIPVSFDFSGVAILAPYVSPADQVSEVIEINNKSTENSDDIDIQKEEEIMADVKDTSIVELNEKCIAQASEISELKRQLEEVNTALNECKEELNACKTKEAEVNELLVEANKTIEAHKSEITELNAEIKPLKELKEKTEKDAATAEINSYFKTIEIENGFTEAELNSLKEEFVEKCDMAGLKAKEQELCIQKFKSMQKVSIKEAEINAATQGIEGIFCSTKTEEHVETNSADGAALFI